MPTTRSQARMPSNPVLPGTPATPGTPVPTADMDPDLEAPTDPVAPPPVTVHNPTDLVLDHALCLVGFDRSHTPDHPVFQCLEEGGYDNFYRLSYLNPEEVRDLAYMNTSVSPPTWTTLSRGNQSALLTLIAYQRYYKATHDGTSLTPTDWLQINVDTINDFILSSDREFYINNSGTSPQHGAQQRPTSLLTE